jgi:dTMP kinase
MSQIKHRRKKVMRGKFIVIDGGEGTGTTTMAKYLAEVFGDKAICTREPGGSQFAEKIRGLILDPTSKEADAETIFALFWAARYDHVFKVIKPALESGKHVFCDRFDSSTWSYQVRAEKHAHLQRLFKEFQLNCIRQTFCSPHRYIILDGDPRICLARAKKRAQVANKKTTHFDDRDLAYHDAVREGFLEFAEEVPNVVINAEQSEEVVKQKVLAAVRQVVR